MTLCGWFLKKAAEWDDIMWLVLEEGCWMAWIAFTCLRINSIGGRL
jgi:hypothetical protein